MIVDYLSDINWFAVLVCPVLSIVVDFFWKDLFRENHRPALPRRVVVRGHIISFLLHFIMATVLAIVLLATDANGLGEIWLATVIVWIGFIGTTIGINLTFQHRPLTVVGYEGGYHLITLLGYALVLWLAAVIAGS